jgi:DNA polymerase III delta subunit
VSGLGYFWGDDEYGLERAADRVAERLAEAGGVPPERRRMTGVEATMAHLEELVATAPLFGGGTLVVITDPAPLGRSAEARQAVVGLLARVAPGNGLVFLHPMEVSRRTADRPPPLAEAVREAGGEIAAVRAPTEGRFAAWIDERASELGVHLGRGAAQELARRVGGFVREGDVDRRRMGLLAVAELQKLALLRAVPSSEGAELGADLSGTAPAAADPGAADPGAAARRAAALGATAPAAAEVTADDVRALVPEAIPASAWAFLDAVATRRIDRAAELLPAMIEQTPAPVLGSMLHRRLRELLDVADRLESGASPGSLVRTLRLNPYRAELLVGQARRWTVPELVAAIDGLLDLDARLKGVPPASESQRRGLLAVWLAASLIGSSASTGTTRGRARAVGAPDHA